MKRGFISGMFCFILLLAGLFLPLTDLSSGPVEFSPAQPVSAQPIDSQPAQASQISESREERAVNLMLSGNLAFRQNRFDTALNLFRSAKSCIEESDRSLLKALITDSIGITYMNLNQAGMAETNLQKALSMSITVNSCWLLSRVYCHIAQLFENNNKMTEAERLYKQAINLSADSNSMLPADFELLIPQIEPLPYENLVSILIDDERYEEAFYYADMKKEYEFRNKIGFIKAPALCSIGDIRFYLGENDAMIEYSIINSNLLIFYLDNNEFKTLKLPLNMKNNGGVTSLIDEKKIQIKDLIPKPILERISSRKNIIIIPDNDLILYRFCAIKDNNSEPLIKNHNLSFALSASCWYNKNNSNTLNGSRVNMFSVLACTCGTYENLLHSGDSISKYQISTDSLSIKNEADALFPLLSPRMLLTGTEMNIDRVLKTIALSQYIHFSTYFIPDSFDITLSGLLLRDGILTAYSVCSNNMAPDLISISNYLKVNSRQDIICLNSYLRALIFSGTQSIILNTGNVTENKRIFIFSEVYKGIKLGIPPGEALQSAQIKAMKAFPGSDDWADFVIISSIK